MHAYVYIYIYYLYIYVCIYTYIYIYIYISLINYICSNLSKFLQKIRSRKYTEK